MSEWGPWHGRGVLDVDARFWTASSCLLWMDTGTATVSSAPAAKPSWQKLAHRVSQSVA